MIHHMTSPIHDDLGRVEMRGRAYLDARGRDAARRAAVSRAAQVLPVMAALVFLAGWFAPLRVEWIAGAILLPPLVVAIGIHAAIRRRQRLDRTMALAALDHGLALKDRLRTVDEFLADADPDGFRAAAIAEAYPAIERALTLPLDPVATTDRGDPRGRRLVMLALALLVAIGLQQWLRPASGGGAVADALARVGAVRGVDRRGRPVDVAADPAGGGPVKASAADRVAGAANGGAGRASGGGAGSGSNPGGGGASATAPSPGAGDAADSAGLGAQAGAGQRSDPAGAHAGMPATADRTPGGGDPARQPGARIDATRTSAPDAVAGRNASTSSAHSDGDGGSPPPSSAPGRQPPASGQGGNGSRPDPRNRSQPGTEGQSSPTDSGKGNGRQAPRTGDDALKAAHGLSALLLAVPMEDRLSAAANPGIVSSISRRGTPRADDAGIVAAQGRGTMAGTAGRIGHGAITPQERRILGEVFRPRHGADR